MPAHYAALACKQGSDQRQRDALRNFQSRFHKEVVMPHAESAMRAPPTSTPASRPATSHTHSQDATLVQNNGWRDRARRKLGLSAKAKVRVKQLRQRSATMGTDRHALDLADCALGVLEEEHERHSRLQNELRERQKEFDKEKLNIPAEALVQRALILMHTRRITYQKEDAMALSESMLELLTSTMTQVARVGQQKEATGEREVGRRSRARDAARRQQVKELKDALGALNNLRKALLQSTAAGTQFMQEVARLDEAMELAERLNEGGCAVNMCIVVGLLVTVHQLLDRWRKGHSEFLQMFGAMPIFSAGHSLDETGEDSNVADVIWHFELESANLLRSIRDTFPVTVATHGMIRELCSAVFEAARDELYDLDDGADGGRHERQVKLARDALLSLIKFYSGATIIPADIEKTLLAQDAQVSAAAAAPTSTSTSLATSTTGTATGSPADSRSASPAPTSTADSPAESRSASPALTSATDSPAGSSRSLTSATESRTASRSPSPVMFDDSTRPTSPRVFDTVLLYEDHALLLILSNDMRQAWMHAEEGPLLEDEHIIRERELKTLAKRKARVMARRKRRAEEKASRNQVDQELLERVVQYEVTVKTGNKRHAGTDANVCITLYGSEGDSGEIPLLVDNRGGDKFERDELDVFVVSTMWLGELNKLRVWHDAVGLGAGWHLEKIMVRDVLERMYHFPCDDWLDNPLRMKKSASMQRFRELVPRPPEITKQDRIVCDWRTIGFPSMCPSALTTYEIKVFTGHAKGAGTDAGVRIMLFGELGYSGPWELTNRWRDLFERGRIDEFYIEAICIGAIRAIQIGHDGHGRGANWLLKQVAVRDVKCGELNLFTCENWLGDHGEDSDEDVKYGMSDYSLGTEVLLTSSTDPSEITVYRIVVTTGTNIGAGTDAHVKLRLFGENGTKNSKWIPLETSLTHRNKFERDQDDEFVVEVPTIGTIKRIAICHDGWGLGAAWYLDQITISDTMDDNKMYRFPCERWLDSGSGDRQIMRDLVVRERGHQHFVPSVGEGKIRHLTKYKLLVFTGQVKGAGTDANVEVTIFGEYGISGPWRLDTTLHDDFERGKMDTYCVEAAWLGDIQHIEIGHDGKHKSAAWYLETVFLRDELNGGEWEFSCRSWLDSAISDIHKSRKKLKGTRTNFSQQKEVNREQQDNGIIKWLNQLKLSHHADIFLKNELTLQALPALKDDHLAHMKLPLSDRTRILREIESMNNQMKKRHLHGAAAVIKVT